MGARQHPAATGNPQCSYTARESGQASVTDALGGPVILQSRAAPPSDLHPVSLIDPATAARPLPAGFSPHRSPR